MLSFTESDINRIDSFAGLLEFLRAKLDWPLDPAATLDELTFDYTADELRVHEAAAVRLHGGIVRQLRDFRPGQQIGIFFVEFNDPRAYITSLRQVLRGLVPNQRQDARRRTWRHENLLFICATKNYERFTFAHFRGQQAHRAVLTTFGWERGDTHLRTLCEFNLPRLEFPADPSDAEGWLVQWRAAFDVEKVTDEFFTSYRAVFGQIEQAAGRQIADAEQRRLYTQRLLNRLMFLYFIQKKGWLSYAGDKNYLRALFQAAERNGEQFLSERLYWLFFYGMGNAGLITDPRQQEFLEQKRGVVPFLNGGLFDIEDEYDATLSQENIWQAARVEVANAVFAQVLNLFERYNFTVTESTPLDVQVAIDPEMLGKVFEELVTGRHESGSYYTPRPVVSFMCREALKHYLAEVEPDAPAVAAFVDDGDAAQLKDPEGALDGLKRVRVCDPACGSGAYLLGMMQELLRLRGALFKSNRLDDESVYRRKREIIERNLYGVDKDRFAVQIACLRLWLSLAIESDKPQPLPNLDFKIGCGDSLTAPAPTDTEKQLAFGRGVLVNEYQQRKGEFMQCNDAERKRRLRDEIERLRGEIALTLKHQPPRPSAQKIEFVRGQVEKLRGEVKRLDRAGQKPLAAKQQKQLADMQRQLAAWAEVKEEAAHERPFDWAVEFAEVFMPTARETWRMDDLHPLLNDFKQQGTLIEQAQPDTPSGGFDIVLANPPYVRMELFKPIKPTLRRNFPAVHSDRADLYVYFYDRAQQLLKDGGIGAFISPHKWLRAGYGENLRQHLLDKQAFHLVVNFGDLPVFKATAYPAIFIWQKLPRDGQPTTWAVIEDLQACYNEGVREYVTRIAHIIPASQFGQDRPRLATSSATERLAKMAASGPRLGELCKGKIMWGIKTGLNEAFFIDSSTRNSLITENPECEEIVKSLVVGEDVRPYEIQFRGMYLLYMFHGINIRRYPSVRSYLKPFRSKLEARATQQEWYELQQPQAAYTKHFDQPKIMYPVIAKQPRFAMDLAGHYCNDKTYVLAVRDWYILGLLNSQAVRAWIAETLTTLRGGYYEFRAIYMEKLPIPDAPTAERETVAKLARQAQELHTKRRRRVEKFLRAVGIAPAASSSRNPLEQPWTLSPEEFTRRSRHAPLPSFTAARDETHALTAQITTIERELDERVAALYGVPTGAG